MANGEKSISSKIVPALVIFFIIGFLINSFYNYTQSTILEEKLPVAEETLKEMKEISSTLKEQTKKLDEISNRLKVLEDNSKNSNTNTGN